MMRASCTNFVTCTLIKYSQLHMQHKDIADIRKDYKLKSLQKDDIDNDPLVQFHKWWKEAIKAEIPEPNAMTLATCDNQGRPSARIVLLKDVHENGFVFFTNYESKKGKQMEINANVALVFLWKELERQVRIEGFVTKISVKESDEYFATRPAKSRIGAWSSPQSEVIESREILEKNVEYYNNKFGNENIPRPDNWGGYIVYPRQIEFWQGRRSRLHDRLQYTISDKKEWTIERLAP